MNTKVKEILNVMHYEGIRKGLLEYLDYIEDIYNQVKNLLPGEPHDVVDCPYHVIDFTLRLSEYKKDDTLNLFMDILTSDYWGGREHYPYVSVLEDGHELLDFEETRESLPFVIRAAIVDVKKPETLVETYLHTLNLLNNGTKMYLGESKYQTRLRSSGRIDETITIPKLKGKKIKSTFKDYNKTQGMDYVLDSSIDLNLLIRISENSLAQELMNNPESNILEILGLNYTRDQILKIHSKAV